MPHGFPNAIWFAIPWAVVMLASGLQLKAAEPGPATTGYGGQLLHPDRVYHNAFGLIGAETNAVAPRNARCPA